MAQYFQSFPKVEYNNQQAVNILTRVKIKDVVKKYQNVFSPLTLQEGERADMIANDYYGDSFYDWLVYLSNDLVDPYYAWPLDSRTLDKVIIDKYGSLPAAQSTILFYQNRNQPDVIISVDSYADQEIPGDWWPVNAYDYEYFLNNVKSEIILIQARYATQIRNELEQKLK